MSGSKVNDFSIGDSNIQSVMLTLDKAYKGLHQVSLTNYDNTSESQIAAGSVIENNGALYQFTSNESITGSPSNGTVYIRLVPDGDTITAEYTNTAPTWSDSKQGWYGTGGDANKRYIGGVTKSSAAWTYKFILNDMNGMGFIFYKNNFSFASLLNLSLKTIEIEDLQMYATGKLLLDTWSSSNNTEQYFNFIIKKPCRIYFSNSKYPDRVNAWTPNTLYPGKYSIRKRSDSTMWDLYYYATSYDDTVVRMQISDNTAGVLYNTPAMTFYLYCNYAEGTNSLDDVSKIYETI